MRSGTWSRLSASMIVTSLGRSAGSSSRSLTRITTGLRSLSWNAIRSASSSPAETFVPALNVLAHGFGGKAGAKPPCAGGSVK